MGTDLIELFDRLDGHRAMNVVDALIQEDTLLGQHLDDNGLSKIRVQIMKMHESRDDYSSSRNSEITEVPSLYNGEILQETGDESNPFGLREAPAG